MSIKRDYEKPPHNPAKKEIPKHTTINTADRFKPPKPEVDQGSYYFKDYIITRKPGFVFSEGPRFQGEKEEQYIVDEENPCVLRNWEKLTKAAQSRVE